MFSKIISRPLLFSICYLQYEPDFLFLAKNGRMLAYYKYSLSMFTISASINQMRSALLIFLSAAFGRISSEGTHSCLYCTRLRRLHMGAPKQRWTSEEEAALRTGVAKHGVGNWRTILNDPELSPILCYRSNVDLKVKTVHLISLKLALFNRLPNLVFLLNFRNSSSLFIYSFLLITT